MKTSLNFEPISQISNTGEKPAQAFIKYDLLLKPFSPDSSRVHRSWAAVFGVPNRPENGKIGNPFFDIHGANHLIGQRNEGRGLKFITTKINQLLKTSF